MLEEIRNHDSAPTREEREWIDSNPVTLAVRFAVFVVFSVAIGGYVSLYNEPAAPTVAKAGK
jgi:hypothetical protein